MENNSFKMEQFDMAVLNGTATWWQMYLPSGEVFFGEAKTKMLGYTDNIFKNYQDFVNIVHPEDMEKVMQAMRDHLEGKTGLYKTTYRIKHKDGEYINFYDCGQITKRDGENLVVSGFVMKILDGIDVIEQMKDFKELILSGNPPIIELFSKIK
ncbi:MAG: PAS domain-containing protein [Candidatus Parcubacteria bacterium]|nr:PAS domain-containing protein [Candidatus Parcubacteria bacterium]